MSSIGPERPYNLSNEIRSLLDELPQLATASSAIEGGDSALIDRITGLFSHIKSASLSSEQKELVAKLGEQLGEQLGPLYQDLTTSITEFVKGALPQS